MKCMYNMYMIHIYIYIYMQSSPASRRSVTLDDHTYILGLQSEIRDALDADGQDRAYGAFRRSGGGEEACWPCGCIRRTDFRTWTGRHLFVFFQYSIWFREAGTSGIQKSLVAGKHKQ